MHIPQGVKTAAAVALIAGVLAGQPTPNVEETDNPLPQVTAVAESGDFWGGLVDLADHFHDMGHEHAERSRDVEEQREHMEEQTTYFTEPSVLPQRVWVPIYRDKTEG